MQIGVPKEIKNHEYRVGLTPGAARDLTAHGHKVFVETKAAAAIGFSDHDYEAAGAEIVPDAADVFERAQLIVKVKEPQPEECKRLRPHHILFTFLHLAADPEQARALLASGATAIAYETVTNDWHELPLLLPMSEVAGRMSVQVGAHFLEREHGGKGILLGGVPGVAPGQVTIIGGGTAGAHAARMAVGLGADVTIIERSQRRIQDLSVQFGAGVHIVYSTKDTIEAAVCHSDVVIGAVLVPGDAAPKLVTRAHVKTMEAGSVLVDIAIDQGGCFETSRPTSHDAPTFVCEDVIHYCVTNMPGAVPRTSTLALVHATLPFVMALAEHGPQAFDHNAFLAQGLNVLNGRIVHPTVAEALGFDRLDPAT